MYKHYLILILSCSFIGCQQNSQALVSLEYLYTLDHTLKQNNSLLDYQIINTFMDLRGTTRQQEVLFEKWVAPLKLIIAKSDTLNDYIDTLRERLSENAESYTQKEATEMKQLFLIGKPKNGLDQEIVQSIFLTGQSSKNSLAQGPILLHKITQFKTDCRQLLEQLWDNGGTKGTSTGNYSKKEGLLKEISAELKKCTLLNYSDNFPNKKAWTAYCFEDKPVAVVYPFLRQLQNELKHFTLHHAFFFLQNINTGCNFSITRLAVLNYSNTSSIKLGETYKAEIVLGEYYMDPGYMVVSVDGQQLEISNFKGQYSVTPKKIGTHEFLAKIKVLNTLTQETEVFIRKFSYEVIP